MHLVHKRVGGPALFKAWDTRPSPDSLDMVEQHPPAPLFPAARAWKPCAFGKLPSHKLWLLGSPCPGSDSEKKTGPQLGSGPRPEIGLQ